MVIRSKYVLSLTPANLKRAADRPSTKVRVLKKWRFLLRDKKMVIF